VPDDTEQARASVVARYSQLAREAAAGGRVTHGEGCFGAAGYGETGGVPEAALRASMGCGNPVAVAALEKGETVLDLGSGGGLDMLLSARRVGPAGAGLHSAIIQAVRPAAPDGALIRPMRAGDARGMMAVYQAGLDTAQPSETAAAEPAEASFRRQPWPRAAAGRHPAQS